MKYVTVLSIAGSDCSGGAGIQADIKTISALGCYAAAAITSVTVQNTCGVSEVSNLSPHVVEAQIRAVMDDLSPSAIKIGMMNDADTMHAICRALSDYKIKNLVLDPVMVSSSGDILMREEALDVLKTELLPMATLVTPNLPEAETLAGMAINVRGDISEVACKIIKMGCKAVLVKGGHCNGSVKTDHLVTACGRVTAMDAPCIATRNTHGTGCTLSSAIASYLALGNSLTEAVRLAKSYMTVALMFGQDVEVGHGNGSVNHFFNPKKLIKI